MNKRSIKTSLICTEQQFVVPAMLVYIINRLIKDSITLPIIGYLCRCHLNDFIGGGVFLGYVNILLIISNRKPNHTLRFVLVISLLASVFWEYIAPLFLWYSTSDFWDVVSYMLGALFYFSIIKINAKEKS